MTKVNYQLINNVVGSPKVSVAMLAYNHSDFIVEAIESVLMQKTSFQIELIIAEDFSTDNTRNIIVEYQHKNPQIIKLILQNKNVGASKNNQSLFENLNGKYIAAIEGDDYWTDPLKLQKQIDFLEQNPDYNICFHDFDFVDINSQIVEKQKNKLIQSNSTQLDLAKDNYIQTVTVVLRNNIKEYPSFFYNSPIGDYALFMSHAETGKIKYLPEKMACYRLGSGVWSNEGIANKRLKQIQTVQNFVNYYSDKNQDLVNILQKQIVNLFYFYNKNKYPIKSKFPYSKLILGKAEFINLNPINRLKILAKYLLK